MQRRLENSQAERVKIVATWNEIIVDPSVKLFLIGLTYSLAVLIIAIWLPFSTWKWNMMTAAVYLLQLIVTAVMLALQRRESQSGGSLFTASIVLYTVLIILLITRRALSRCFDICAISSFLDDETTEQMQEDAEDEDSELGEQSEIDDTTDISSVETKPEHDTALPLCQ